MKTKNQKLKGFTLVELIIVMAGFLLIIAVAVVIFISIIQSQRRILAQNQLLNQASYLIEYMSKGLRMARNDKTGSCLVYVDEGGDQIQYPECNYLYTKPFENNYYMGLKFINANNEACQEFYLDSEDGLIKELKDSLNENDAMILVSEKFNVDYFKLSINALQGSISDPKIACLGDTYEGHFQQPRITISMGFGASDEDSRPSLEIQTTVSQRNLNE